MHTHAHLVSGSLSTQPMHACAALTTRRLLACRCYTQPVHACAATTRSCPHASMLLHLTQTPLAHTPRRTQHAPSPAIPHDISASTRAKTHTQTRLLGLFTLRAERERGRDAPSRPLQRNTTAFGKRERERERERDRERERERETHLLGLFTLGVEKLEEGTQATGGARNLF